MFIKFSVRPEVNFRNLTALSIVFNPLNRNICRPGRNKELMKLLAKRYKPGLWVEELQRDIHLKIK